jgi:class 3 adenylate cyclase
MAQRLERMDEHKAASFGRAGGQSCSFGFQRVGCDRISLPRNPQGRKIATNKREMSVETAKDGSTGPLRKPLALVFCDIAGFAHLMAQEGDLVASAVLREFYEHTGRLGREHRSLMIKFIADGLKWTPIVRQPEPSSKV